MKYLLAAFFFVCSFNATAQEKGPVWETDMLIAVERAIKENKPMFLFFTGSDWCGWCRRLHSEVFSQPQFQAWAKKNVILVELDFPRFKQIEPRIQQQNQEIAQMFEIRGYPSVWFVTASKNESQISFGKLGNTGYIAGGPEVWLNEANRILHSQQ